MLSGLTWWILCLVKTTQVWQGSKCYALAHCQFVLVFFALRCFRVWAGKQVRSH